MPGRIYSLYGWTHDNSWSTVNVDFTLDDVTALKPGRVLVLEQGGEHREVSLRQLSAMACAGPE